MIGLVETSLVETKQLEDKITKPFMYAQKCLTLLRPQKIEHYPSQ